MTNHETFVYSGPAAVGSPSAFGRVQLVDKIEPEALKPLGRAFLPMALTKSANYEHLYGTVCVSPSIEKAVVKVERNRLHQSELQSRLQAEALPCDPVASLQIATWVYQQTEKAKGQVWVMKSVLQHLGPTWRQCLVA